MIKILDRKIKGPRRYIYYVLMAYFLYGLLAKNFGLNRNFIYITEVLCIVLFFCHPYKIKICQLGIPFKIMLAMYIASAIGALVHLISPFNYIFGFRGDYLSMVMLFACAAYLKIKDYHHIFALFYKFQFLNVFFTIVQWLVFGYTEDFNNGAFTDGIGQDIFRGVLMTYYFYAYNQKIASLKKLLFVLSSCVFIAIIQDERFIFIEAAIILFYFSLANGFNTKKIATAVIMLGVIMVGLKNLSEDQLETIGSIDGAFQYAQQTGWGYNLPRIGSAPIIQNMFFETPIEAFFGIGLGKATEANLPFLDTSFFTKYQYLNYNWFSFQNLFLQTGWVGITLYVSFFFSLLIYNLYQKYSAPVRYRYLYDITITIALICILVIWYNATLRLSYAIVPYFVLGLGPCVTRELRIQQIKRRRKDNFINLSR